METLSVEMLELIGQQLTPRDLARCSAVCRKWRDVFNQDWMWKPHCDPELEEPLRTIPCVAAPMFVTPKAENSILSPISRWKLAFMRENHLWKNWKSAAMKNDEMKDVITFQRLVVDLKFLTDTLVVVWHSNSIQILDVSVIPAVVVAKTDVLLNNIYKHRDICSVIGATMLLVEKLDSINVFKVDIMVQSIKLKHNISLDRSNLETLVKDNFYLCKDRKNFKLTVFNLNTGEIVKEDSRPVKVHDTIIPFCGIKSSKTSDFVAVLYPTEDEKADYYIYSLKQLAFLPGPVTTRFLCEKFTLHGHWLAVVDYGGDVAKVYDFLTGEEITSHDLNPEGHIVSSSDIFVFKDRFIFVLLCVYQTDERLSLIRIFFPSQRTWITLPTFYHYVPEDDKDCFDEFKMINDKFVAASVGTGRVETIEKIKKLSGQIAEHYDIPYIHDSNCEINQSFTKGLKMERSENGWNPTCYVRCFW